MQEAPNPYQAPAAPEYDPATGDDAPFPASNGRRFGNYVIDLIISSVVAFAFAFVFVEMGIQFAGSDLAVQLIAAVLVWLIPEALFGRSFGKLCTGTKVVNLQGGKPSFGQCLARTAIRFVPFEPFSFLWGDHIGWHDSWSNTRVVPLVEPYSNL